MKSIRKLLVACMAVLSLSVVLVSCGGDDGDAYTKKSVIQSSTDTLLLEGLKSNTDGVATSYTVTFKGHLDSDIYSNLISSETTFQTSGNGIGIYGLTNLGDTAKISDLTLTIGSTEFDLGTCSADGSGDITPDAMESGDTYLSLFRKYFNTILAGSNYSTTVKVSFVTNVNILEENNVTLRIKYAAKYYYKDYE